MVVVPRELTVRVGEICVADPRVGVPAGRSERATGLPPPVPVFDVGPISGSEEGDWEIRTLGP